MKDQLRDELVRQAQAGLPVTYRELARRLGLPPPRTIQRVTEALEQLIEEDVAAGRPLLSAVAVSRVRPGIPGRGFFLKARGAGLFSGDLDGPEAFAFHTRELQRAFGFYGHSITPEVARAVGVSEAVADSTRPSSSGN